LKVCIKETYVYEIEINANTKSDAITKAKKIYKTVPDGYSFSADSCSHEKTTFKVIGE